MHRHNKCRCKILQLVPRFKLVMPKVRCKLNVFLNEMLYDVFCVHSHGALSIVIGRVSSCLLKNINSYYL